MRESPFWRRYQQFLVRDPAADVEDELETHLALRMDDLMTPRLSRRYVLRYACRRQCLAYAVPAREAL